ncbi:MAG TPA: hypothetical protein VFW07_19325 [Parafilimonas sp.]|nr:hypothetical protein [Parafilimonas sp.]
MAKQTSTVTLNDTIGNLTFFKSQDGYMVRAKSGISKDKILSDKRFARTRENMAEFGNAGKSAKALRTPFNSVLQQSSDNRMVSRLAAIMLKVVQSDTTGKRGKRKAVNGDFSLLEDFDFNNKGILSTTLITPFDLVYTRASGNIAFDLPSYIPTQNIAAPQGATHYQLQLAAAPVDFNAKKNPAQAITSSILPWNDTATTPLSLTLALPAASTLPVFILLQVQFLTQVNADYYPLNNGAYNACAIIKVDKS